MNLKLIIRKSSTKMKEKVKKSWEGGDRDERGKNYLCKEIICQEILVIIHINNIDNDRLTAYLW